MRKMIAILLSLIILLTTGCQMADSYMLFSIEAFDAFQKLYENADKEAYLNDGKLDFAKVNDVAIVPFVKEISHEECALFVYAYTLTEQRFVGIDNITLVTQDGKKLVENLSGGQLQNWENATDAMSYGFIKVANFALTEDWYTSGNKLMLSFRVVVGEENSVAEKEITHTISLVRYKSFLMPT